MNLDKTLRLINTTIRAISPYHLTPEETAIKLNQNENPFDWPRAVKEEAARFCIKRKWNLYPTFVPERLKDALADYAGTKRGGVIVGNGSNEMLLVLLLALAGKDKTVVFCQPTFTVYRLLAGGMGAVPVAVPLDSGLRYDIPAIIGAVRKHPAATLILCSPNNPTGSVLSEQELRSILAVHRGFCILDQAYVEFGGYNAVALLLEFPNLIITRTFSKALAGAGLRLGYLLGTPAVVEEINKIKLPYNINFFSEHVAGMLLQKRSLLKSGLTTIVAQREDLSAFLRSLPFDNIYPSAANFILVRYREKKRLFDALKRSGILVRDVSSYPMLENCLRISVGSEVENTALKKALTTFFTGRRTTPRARKARKSDDQKS